MSPAAGARLARAIVVDLVWILTLAAGVSSAQPAADTGCTLSPGEYERTGYVLRRVNVRHVLNFLRIVSPLGNLSDQFPQQGAPFSVDAANRAEKALTSILDGRPQENDSPFAVTIVVGSIEHCTSADGPRQLDLVFRVLTTRIPLMSGLTPESRKAQDDDPALAVGSVRRSVPITFAPRIAYDAADRTQAGGQLALHPRAGFIRSASLEGRGSSTSHLILGSVSGIRNSPGPFTTSDWRVSWSDAESPVADDRMKERRLLAQAATETRPFGQVGAIVRLGASLEGGTQGIDLAERTLDPTLLAQSGYGSLRSYVGTAWNTEHHQLSGSYGLLLGRVTGGGLVDYRKHIADLAYAVRKNVADHRTLSIESRVTAGWLDVPHLAPASERFFGGNVPHDFIESNAWSIRDRPFIRSFPNNYLGSSLDGSTAGGSNFQAFNLTGSIPLWRIPLVPSEISTLAAFRGAIEVTKGTARQQLSSYYRAKDPAQRTVENEVVAVSSSLNNLFQHATDIQASTPQPLRPGVKDCADAADEARDKMRNLGDTGYGPIATVIVPDVVAACPNDLVAGLSDPVIASELDHLQALARRVSAALAAINEPDIKDRVEEDLGFAFRAFDTFVQEVNVVSVGPVLFFDAARLGHPSADPSAPPDRFRYAIGGGVRVAIMNLMNITAGYAWNPSRRGSEKAGAFAVSFELIDLFR
jgi:hypothetical protein